MVTLEQARTAKRKLAVRLCFPAAIGITLRKGDYGLSVAVPRSEYLSKVPETVDEVTVFRVYVTGTVQAQKSAN